MNERINQLAEEAGIAIWGDAVYMYHPKDTLDSDTLKKFAELIVKECAVYCEGHVLPKGMAEENGLNYNDGVRDCAIGLILELKNERTT